MRFALVLSALAMVLGGCAGATDAESPTTAPTPAADPGDLLPPHTRDALAELFTPIVEPLGFRVTRASLVDLTTYRASPEGRHLAVYVTPMEEFTAAEHAEAFIPLATAFLPHVFERWPGLESFDICQEPRFPPAYVTPPAITVLDLDRATAETIAWEAVDLSGLIALARVEPRLTVTASTEIAASEPWSDAAGE